MSGQNSKSEWWYQLLDNDTSDTQVLAEKFNTFSLNLTAHFHPLSGDVLTDPTPVPAEFLVLEYHAYKALLTIKSNESSGPNLSPSRI